jgi:hypothetical protein
MQVQSALLDAGCTLIQRWYADMPWGTQLWRATQLLALHQVMDRPADIERDNRIPLAAHTRWGVNELLKPDELRIALTRLAELKGTKSSLPALPEGKVSFAALADALKAAPPEWSKALTAIKPADANQLTAAEFAVIAAKVLLP